MVDRVTLLNTGLWLVDGDRWQYFWTYVLGSLVFYMCLTLFMRGGASIVGNEKEERKKGKKMIENKIENDRE